MTDTTYKHSRCFHPDAIGKKQAKTRLLDWRPVESTIDDLIQWLYIEGRPIAHGVFDYDTPLRPDEKIHKTRERWHGSQFIVIDSDDGATLESLISNPFVQAHAAAVIPSSSYTPDYHKAHILFPLTDMMTGVDQYAELTRYVSEQFNITIDKSTLNVAQALFGTLFEVEPMIGVPTSRDDGLLWVNPAYTPINGVRVLASRIEAGLYLPDSPKEQARVAYDSAMSKRVLNHEAAPDELRTSIVLEALSFALDEKWGEQEHNDRFKLLVAAHAGSNDYRVRDAFLKYSSPRWDASNQRADLFGWWERFRPKTNGITVATLFHAARENGWLRKSSVELNGAEKIYVEEVADWLLKRGLPDRILLKSPTGTGKTQGAIALLKRMQSTSHAPIKAVFFAPSIKLCHALSASLSKAGVDNTLYIEGGRKTKDAATLRDAQVLVTTLQTFAVKVHSAGSKPYDLVVMDECDELLGAFVRSGIGGKLTTPSHVDRNQARLGVEALVSLFADAGRVLMLDGTMTELSRYIMGQWSHGQLIGVYENTYSREKAPVTLYGSLQSLRDDLVKSVLEGKRVVVACDTKAEAARIETLLILTEAVNKESILRITSDTAADERVNRFFRDVEAGAQQYRVVIYNSAMGSGVSIINTSPDKVYLIATYLSPRKLLQMLNRYRVQQDVRAYIQPKEALYSVNIDDRMELIRAAARVEEALSGLTRVARDDLAKVVTNAGLIVAVDEYDQTRSVREFFSQLLIDDGREVHYHWSNSKIYESAAKQAHELLKSTKEEARAGWRSVPPIRRGDPFPQGITPEDATKGLLHGYIDEVFPDCPEGACGLEDREIAELALSYGRKRGIIKRWLQPETIMNTTLNELQNSRKQETTYRLYLARVELITMLSILFPDSNGKYDDATIEMRSKRFNREIRRRQAVYDLMIPSEYRMEAVESSGKDELGKALIYARQLLKVVGLNIKRTNGKARKDGTRDRRSIIDGTDRLICFLRLSRIGREDSLKDFNRASFIQASDLARKAAERFITMNDSSRKEILDALDDADMIDFYTAVNAQATKQFTNL